ncbi:hypothetical protein WJX73_000609 [Symbiochloris irregularis]|uniref:RAP domain-containing protein n=1 Tax=Symbiochloris irregularis TaxID=706552 RepID=A0AAW1NN42_9CHLO
MDWSPDGPLLEAIKRAATRVLQKRTKGTIRRKNRREGKPLYKACTLEVWQAGAEKLSSRSHQLSTASLKALYQSALQTDQHAAHGLVLSSPLMEQARAAWTDQAGRERQAGLQELMEAYGQQHDEAADGSGKVTDFQKALQSVLEACGQQPKLQLETADGNFTLDLAMPDTGIALEAAGPSHFAANRRMFLGDAMARHRSILARGWILISVPCFVWDQLQTEQAQMHAMTKVRFTSMTLQGCHCLRL